MQIGAIFPQTELSADPGAIREFVQAVEAMGYAHLFVADHVLGADTRFHHHPSLASYSYKSVVHEPLTLLGYIAAITTRLTLATGILILPQRQTALVAKQAAEIDVLSGGRLRLGIGVGWNQIEYEALNQDFHTRGRRSAEQIAVLRALWTQQVVDFHGRWHHISHAGLNPLPVQRPIPIWFGVGSSQNPQPPETVLRRVARLADGWSPNIPTNADGKNIVARVHQYAKEAGRDPATLPLEGRVRIAGKSPAEWVNLVQAWAGLGATHIIVETRGGGLVFPHQHLAVLRQFQEVVGPVLAV
ncbi:MAG TPA: LLM class F420-dependent oxidoreductase [Candidatus Tectomicrobia bacterium]